MLSAFNRYRLAVESHRADVGRPLRLGFGVALAFLLLHVGVVAAFVLPRLGSLHFLRLHYTARQGVDWVAEWYYLLLFPAVAAVTLAVNFAAGSMLARRNRSLGTIVAVTTAALEALMAVGGVLAVLLNL